MNDETQYQADLAAERSRQILMEAWNEYLADTYSDPGEWGDWGEWPPVEYGED